MQNGPSPRTDALDPRVQWSHRLVVWTAGIHLAMLGTAFLVAGATGRLTAGTGDLSPGALFGIGLLEAGAVTYTVWAAFWGVPVAWRWWRALGRALDRVPGARWWRPVFPLSLPAYGFLYLIVLSVGLGYGWWGGAFYEYARRRRWIGARRRALPDQAEPSGGL